jgi:hypothetical protein
VDNDGVGNNDAMYDQGYPAGAVVGHYLDSPVVVAWRQSITRYSRKLAQITHKHSIIEQKCTRVALLQVITIRALCQMSQADFFSCLSSSL